jgi:hypothetical protein
MFLDFASTVQAAVERQGTAGADQKALAVTAGMIGTAAVARAVKGRGRRRTAGGSLRQLR